MFTWKAKPSDEDSEGDYDMDINEPENAVANTRWGISKRDYFNQPGTKVNCSTFHAASNLLVVGFTQRSAEVGEVSASDCGIPVVFLPVSERELKSPL